MASTLSTPNTDIDLTVMLVETSLVGLQGRPILTQFKPTERQNCELCPKDIGCCYLIVEFYTLFKKSNKKQDHDHMYLDRNDVRIVRNYKLSI